MTIAPTQDSYAQYRDVKPYGDTARRFTVQWSWANKVVASCYPGGFPALTLKDDEGGIGTSRDSGTYETRCSPKGSWMLRSRRR